MIVKLLTERHLVCISLKGVCTGWSESTLVKVSNCWISHALATGIKAKEHLANYICVITRTWHFINKLSLPDNICGGYYLTFHLL